MKLEMKIISKDMIKPSSPTPLHLKTFKLSILDQLFGPFHFPLLLFYNNNNNNNNNNAPSSDSLLTHLKSSLSHTLFHFYPLAGRCIDNGTVSCNDQGIPFIETHVNSCRLTEFLTLSNKLDFVNQLLPPQEILRPEPRLISDMVPLAIQINVFSCGGLVIGCFMLHKFLDTSALGTFFNFWAAMTSQRYHDLVSPAFDPIIRACPSMNLVEAAIEPAVPESRPVIEVLVKSFRFSKTAINDLKVMAGTEVQPKPTAFETVWESVVAAGCSARMAASESVLETTALSIVINMRPRTKLPLPKNSMGNCVIEVVGNATRSQGTTFQDLVREIHSTVCKAKSTIKG